MIPHCLVEAGFTLSLSLFSFSIYAGLQGPSGHGCPNLAPSIPGSLPEMNVVSYRGSPMFVTSAHRGTCHQSYAQQHRVIFRPCLCFSNRSCQANKSRFYDSTSIAGQRLSVVSTVITQCPRLYERHVLLGAVSVFVYVGSTPHWAHDTVSEAP